MPPYKNTRREIIQVEKSFKTKDGIVTFKGTLTQDEADYVIGVGLNYLMQQGALPFTVIDDESTDDVGINTDDETPPSYSWLPS